MKPAHPPSKATHAPAVKRPFAVSWLVAGIVAALGAGLLGFGVIRMQSGSQPAAPAQAAGGAQPAASKDLQGIQVQIDAAEAELAALREKNKPARIEYETLAAANKAEEERTKKRRARIVEEEKAHRERITDAQRKVEELKNTETVDTAAADKIIAQREEAEKQFQKFQQDVVKLRDAIVTVVSSGGTIATGFLFSTPDGPVIVTVSGAAPEDAQVAINIRRSGADGEVRFENFKARILLADKPTGLTFLTFDKAGEMKGASFDASFVRDGLAGEKVYAIATQVINGRAVDFSIFDGVISAANRKHAKRDTLQVALAVNAGSLGAPLLTPDLKLAGILLAAVEDLEKTSVAVHARDLVKAVERIPKR